LLLALVSSALALTVPLRATFQEEVAPGEAPTASSALTATVALSNPTTGGAFLVAADELTVNKREASGGGRVSFAGSPADSLRTWAIYFLDASGDPLGDPEVVDMLFDAEGNGAVAARDGGAPRIAKLGVSESGARITVQDAGTLAASIGIVELGRDSSGSELTTDPDMEVMDAATYAAFQEIGLDAIVALDTYKVQLEGDLSVSGLRVATDGTIESGAELRWDLTFYDGRTTSGCASRGCEATTPGSIGAASYASAIEPIKKKRTAPQRVTLKHTDLTFDSWNAGFLFSIEGDVRDLELGASLDTFLGAEATAASDVVSLDPGGYEVEAKADDDDDDDDTGMIVDIFIDGDCEDCGDYDFTAPDSPPAWSVVAEALIEVSVLDSGGGLVGTHACTLAPTAGTVAGTSKQDVLLGECTRDSGGTEVRRLRATVGPLGISRWTVDMAGAAFAAERTLGECSRQTGCTTETVSVVGGTIELAVRGRTFLSQPIAVTATQYDLPFSFEADVDGLQGVLAIDLEDPTRPLTWTVADGVAHGWLRGEAVYSIDLDDLELAPTGMYALKGREWTAEPKLHEGGESGWVRYSKKSGEIVK
jgi:hypothetical protein